jgi:hypothetical protein
MYRVIHYFFTTLQEIIASEEGPVTVRAAARLGAFGVHVQDSFDLQ